MNDNFEVESSKDFHFSLEDDMELLYKTPPFYVHLYTIGKNKTRDHNKIIFTN